MSPHDQLKNLLIMETYDPRELINLLQILIFITLLIASIVFVTQGSYFLSTMICHLQLY